MMLLLFIFSGQHRRTSILPKQAIGCFEQSRRPRRGRRAAADPFPRLGKWTVGDQYLSFAPTNADGVLHTLETVAEDSHLPSVHFVDPIGDVVPSGHVFLAFGAGAHQHHVAHRKSSFHRFIEREGAKSTFRPDKAFRQLGSTNVTAASFNP